MHLTVKLNEQRQWYENWHIVGGSSLPVENMKQGMRLYSLSEALQGLHSKKLLVIGCGDGNELEYISTETLVAFDLSHNAVRKAKSQMSDGLYMQASGMELPFPDGTFDAILTSEVIEHIIEPERMMTEIVRVLAPQGSVIISTPNWMSFFGLARKIGEFVLGRPVTSDDQPVDNWSTPQSLRDLLESSGLSVIEQRGAWYFPPTGLGHRRLPDQPMANLFGRLMPVEKWMQTSLPGRGHLLIFVAEKSLGTESSTN